MSLPSTMDFFLTVAPTSFTPAYQRGQRMIIWVFKCTVEVAA